MARLNRLVENLLDLSRLQAGALTLNLRATTLEEVLPAALADAARRLEVAWTWRRSRRCWPTRRCWSG